MARQRTVIDNSMIVTGVILFILTVSLFGVTGVVGSQRNVVSFMIYSISFSIASWHLITAILAIVSGVTGNKSFHVAVIITSVLAILAALGDGIYFSTLASTAAKYETVGYRYSYNNFGYIKSLAIGVAVINFLIFISSIIILSIECSSQPAVVSNASNPTGGLGGHTLSAPPYGSPPGYIQNPPPQSYGNINAGYDMQSYGKS